MTENIFTTTTNQAADIGDMVKVTCHLCGYVWNTESNKIMVTCPSCMRKTPVKQASGGKKE